MRCSQAVTARLRDTDEKLSTRLRAEMRKSAHSGNHIAERPLETTSLADTLNTMTQSRFGGGNGLAENFGFHEEDLSFSDVHNRYRARMIEVTDLERIQELNAALEAARRELGSGRASVNQAGRSGNGGPART